MKICAHTLVKNEERFIWYSVVSVIKYVDRVLLWDTGSTDKTLEIIREIKEVFPEKVEIKELGNICPEKFTEFRQKMLEATDADWVLVLDGDEVWWEDSIKKVVSEINKNKIDAIVSPFINPVGDIFHYQGESVGRYKIDGRVGNITIRAFSKAIKGLRVSEPYGSEGYFDLTDKPIQESDTVKRKFVDAPFLHLTHLTRSSKDFDTMGRKGKVKHEIGNSFPLDFYYPEVFFRASPEIVEPPWQRMNRGFKFRAFFETPLRKIKRRILQ